MKALGFEAPPDFKGRSAPRTPEEEGAEYGAATLTFLEALEKHFSFEEGFKRLKFHQRMTCGWLEFGHALQAASSRAKTFGDLRETTLKFFSCEQRMFAKTHLRE